MAIHDGSGGQISDLKAPRVTLAEVEANISSEHYFTGDQGVLAATTEKVYDLQGGVVQPEDAVLPPAALRTLTFCVLVLRNGTRIVGLNYGAIDPAQHNAKLGKTAAREDAVRQIWPLMGYALRERLHGR